ncbi:hypothetical protein C1891_15690 [Pseudomonas sp. GW456-12-1-14-TSB6]|nr:hypothetical protein C1891_15690 [Pseudomonas sp. GW456-12-1-14-TSB6]
MLVTFKMVSCFTPGLVLGILFLDERCRRGLSREGWFRRGVQTSSVSQQYCAIELQACVRRLSRIRRSCVMAIGLKARPAIWQVLMYGIKKSRFVFACASTMDGDFDG